MVFLCRIYRDFRAFDNPGFGMSQGGLDMSTLLVSLAAVSAVEAVKMISSGGMLAVAVYKAAKTGRRGGK